MCCTHMWKLMFSVFWMSISLKHCIKWFFKVKSTDYKYMYSVALPYLKCWFLWNPLICQKDLECQVTCFWCISTSISQIIGYLKKKNKTYRVWDK